MTKTCRMLLIETVDNGMVFECSHCRGHTKATDKYHELRFCPHCGFQVAAWIGETLKNSLQKKWEPRGGEWYLNQDNSVCRGVSPTSVRMAGRAYRTKEEAERAANLHRMLDRLVKWLMEHCPDLSVRDALIRSDVFSDVTVRFLGTPGNSLTANLNSGEVEL